MDLDLERSALGPVSLSRQTLKRGLCLLLQSLDLQGCDCILRLSGDRTIADLNRRFLGFCGPTNVLSFPEEAELKDSRCLGQICLSVETMSREAYLYGQDPVEHLFRLLAHGILHLAGYDHGPVMQELTERAVRAIRDWPEKDLLLAG